MSPRHHPPRNTAADRPNDRRRFLFSAAAWTGGLLLGAGFARPARAARRPRLALIIDDIGYSRRRARQFMDLGVPLTFAVLPRLPRSGLLASEASRRGYQVLLHQPMEPFDASLDPGPGAVYCSDSPRRIRRVVQENLDSLPGAVGVNNHMGSRFTSRPLEITAALDVIGQRNLFFVDSLTSRRSLARQTARRMGLQNARRHHFIDADTDPDAGYGQLVRLRQRALRRGHAVGIGHPRPRTVAALTRFIADGGLRGLDLVSVSAVL